MAEFDRPTYVLDLRDKIVRQRIENAIPNRVVNVLVRTDPDRGSPSIAARGVLTDEGMFDIKVVTSDGEQNFTWNYKFLLDAVRISSRDAM